jgi:hypothetical protein
MLKLGGGISPGYVKGIPVQRKCNRFHFLQATEWDAPSQTEVGKYILHYADGQERELPLVFGRDLANWWLSDKAADLDCPGGAVPVWRGEHPKAARSGCTLCLYGSTRENPRPEAEVLSMDFVSNMTDVSPFLVAVTVESGATPTHLAAAPRRQVKSAPDDRARSSRFPPRDPRAGSEEIDLSRHYNLELTRDGGMDVGDFGPGLKTLGGVRFDARGAIELTSQMAKGEGFQLPEGANDIRIGRKCRRLHFLQAVGWEVDKGVEVGRYVLHYADGGQEELPIVMGRDTGSWWLEGLPGAPSEPGGAIPVWSGRNRANDKDGCALYFYRWTRENPRPDAELVSIDFRSSLSPGSPILLALTVE